jgi:hypothetical protein
MTGRLLRSIYEDEDFMNHYQFYFISRRKRQRLYESLSALLYQPTQKTNTA